MSQGIRNLFSKTDKLFFHTPRDETIGRINYMIEKMPGIKRKPLKITKSIKKKYSKNK